MLTVFLQDLFDKIDKDQDGSITFEEYVTFMSTLPVEEHR